MTGTQADLIKARTKALALEIVQLVESLPRSRSADVLGRQLLRSCTSVAANYRAACRARSKPEFLAKLGIVEEEADETLFWLELLTEVGLIPADRSDRLRGETNQILAIIVASIRTGRR